MRRTHKTTPEPELALDCQTDRDIQTSDQLRSRAQPPRRCFERRRNLAVRNMQPVATVAKYEARVRVGVGLPRPAAVVIVVTLRNRVSELTEFHIRMRLRASRVHESSRHFSVGVAAHSSILSPCCSLS